MSAAVARPSDRWGWLIVAIGVLSFVVLLWLGRGMTFFWDEWDFIATRSLGDPATWLPPHNEHWSTLPILVYRAMVETIGIGSYMPYLAVVALLHLAVVAAVYRLVRVSTQSGPLAVAAGLIVALFGSGFENLFWGFQTGFVGATALCLWAMVALRTDGPPSLARLAIAIALLVAALATAGVTIAFMVGIGVEMLLDPRRRRSIPWLAIPALVWATWYVTIGRSAAGYAGYPIGPDTPAIVARVVVAGFSNAAGAVTGLGPRLGAVAVAIIAIAAVWRWRQGKLAPAFVGAIAAIFALYAVLGITRGGVDPEVASNPRFTYESGVLLLVGIAALLGPVRLPASRRIRTRVTALVGTIVVISLAFNLRLLIDGRELMLERADLTRALITVALDPDRPPGGDPNRSLIVVPSPASLEQVVARYGSPLGDRLVQDSVRPIPADTLAEARQWLIDGPPPKISGG